MNLFRRYITVSILLLAVLPVLGQEKKDKEIKLNEDAVKLIQFDFLPTDVDHNEPMMAPIEKPWMEYKNPLDEGISRSITDDFVVKKVHGYIRLCPYSIWTKWDEDPVYDKTIEGRPVELVMNEGPDFNRKLQTDYGYSRKPSPGRTYEMLNNSTSIQVGKIFKKYIRPILKKNKE